MRLNHFQILKIDHALFVSSYIRQRLNSSDAATKALQEELEQLNNPDADEDNSHIQEAFGSMHISMGSHQNLISLRDLENSPDHHRDDAFQNFRIRLMRFLNHFLPAHGILSNGVTIAEHNTV